MAFINLKIAEAIAYPSVNLVFSDDTTVTKEVTALNYTVDLKAVTSNTVISYIWQRKKDTGVWQNLIATDTNTKQDIISVDGIHYYRCKILDENNLESAYSNEIAVDFTLSTLVAPTVDIDVVGDLESTNESITVSEETIVSLTGEQSVSNNGGTITNYNWQIIASPSGNETTTIENNQLFSLDVLAVGNYVIKLIVTDSLGSVSEATFAIVVEAASPGALTSVELYDDAYCVVSGVWNDGAGGTLRHRVKFTDLVIGDTYTTNVVVTPTAPASIDDQGIPGSFVAQQRDMFFTYDVTFTNQTDQTADIAVTATKDGVDIITVNKTHTSANTSKYSTWLACPISQ